MLWQYELPAFKTMLRDVCGDRGGDGDESNSEKQPKQQRRKVPSGEEDLTSKEWGLVFSFVPASI